MNNPDDQDIYQSDEEASSDSEELQDDVSDESELIEDEANSEELEDEAQEAILEEPEEEIDDVPEDVVEVEVSAESVYADDTDGELAAAATPLAEEDGMDDPDLAAMMAGVHTSDGDAEEEESSKGTEADGEDDGGDLPIAEIAAGAVALGAASMAMDAQQQEREAKKRKQEEERIAREKEREQKQLEREAAQKAAAEAREQASQARSETNRFRAPEGGASQAERPPRPERPDRPAPPAFPRPPASAGLAPPTPMAGFGASEEGEAEPIVEVDAVSSAENSEETASPVAPAVGVAPPVRSSVSGSKPAAKTDDMAEREAARKAAIEAKKAESEAKRIAHQQMLDQKAAERKAANESRLGGRESSGASHASDFADMRGPVGGTPTAGAPMNDKMAKMAALAAGAGSVAGALTTKLAQAKAEQGSPVAPVAAAAGAPAAPLPPGANDYLDIIQHLDARAVFHSEYADVKHKYESRLLVGTEVLQCTLVGLNAGLIDSVYRKLSKLPDLMSLIDWKYVALEPVIVVSEGGQKRDVRIDASSTITIGRDPSSTIPIQSSFVSRNHAQIANASKNPHLPPQWVLKDLGSTHGTTLNGTPVREPMRFTSEDKIELGRGFASTDYPSIQLISRAIPYGRDDLTRMVIDVDLVICVVEADREFEGQANLLKNLSDVQKVGGLLVVAVSGSGPIEDSMEANLDELRHASRVLKSTELTRYLAAIDSDDISPDAEWLPGVTEFIDGFRQRSHANIIEKRKQITREEVVNEIRSTGSRLEDSLSKKLEDAERNLQRVQDELSMAPRNLGSAEVLRDDAFKALKQTLDDDSNFFSDPLRPNSLSYYAERLAKQLLTRTEGRTRLVMNLVEPNERQDPHRWLNGELSLFAKRHFDQLIAQLTGPQRDPHGVVGIFQNLRELLGGHEKLRTSDLFSDENYIRYSLTDLNNQMATALSANFVEYDASTEAKIDNVFMYVINKIRFAVMFFMSMFTIFAVVTGLSRGKLVKGLSFSLGPSWYVISITALIIVAYFTHKAYRQNKLDTINEEVEKMRDQLTKHYQAVAKKFVEDAKRVLSVHLTTMESKIKQDMSTLGSSRVTESVATRNNPVLDQAKKERDDTQALIYAIGQERTWAESAQSAYTPSPFVAVAPARPTRTPAR